MKKNKILFALGVLTLFAYSCNKNKRVLLNANRAYSHSEFTSISSVTGYPLHHLSDSLFFPSSITIIEDYLIISERTSNNLMHIIDLNEEKYLGLFGKRGTGPGELLNSRRFFSSQPNEIGVLDNEIGKIIIYNFDSLLQKNKYKSEYNIKEAMHSSGLIAHEDQLYILGNYNENSRIISTNPTRSSTPAERFGSLPKLNINYPNINEFEQKTTLNHAKISNFNNIVLVSYFNIPLFQLFDLEKNQEQNIIGPDPLPVDELIGETLYYYSSFITENYIYLLYIEEKTEFKFTSSSVLVFNHSGEPVRKINLDKEVFQIAIHQDQFLYGLTYENNADPFTIFKFSLE